MVIFEPKSMLIYDIEFQTLTRKTQSVPGLFVLGRSWETERDSILSRKMIKGWGEGPESLYNEVENPMFLFLLGRGNSMA
jgi:hypothetical protein